MCNDFGNHIPYSDYLAAFSEIRLPVRFPRAAPNLEPREDIWPTDQAPVIRRLEDATNEFTTLRWGFPPARPRVLRPSISGRRGGVSRSAGVWCRRPISSSSPAPTAPKTKWKFTKAGEDWFCFAGLCVDAGRRRSLHAANDRARAGCCPDPRPTDGDPGTHGLVGLA